MRLGGIKNSITGRKGFQEIYSISNRNIITRITNFNKYEERRNPKLVPKAASTTLNQYHPRERNLNHN